MRLFHVSEEANIEVFNPRIPARKDLDQSVGLVWAIDEKRLPNFLTPRDCPRVAYCLEKTLLKMIKKLFLLRRQSSIQLLSNATGFIE